MTLSISISSTAEAKLREKADAHGQPLDKFVAEWLERAAVAPTVEDLLAPFRQQVVETGMSDEELDGFLEVVRETAYQERVRRTNHDG